MNTSYRSDIDGLRALAVLPVIFYHADISFFSGGFVGVDIFFVISGYLITKIIIKDLNNENFSYLYFLERRIRRILPALLFIIILTIPVSFLLLTANDLIKFYDSISSIIFFSSNIFFWRDIDGGYFSTNTEIIPLIHTWSLAVEEQFYLLYPFFLIFSFKINKKFATLNLVFFVLVSFIISQWGSINKPIPNFFLLPTRAWELGVGCLIAFYFEKKKIIEINYFYQNILSFIGLILIMISIFYFDKQTPFPSFYTLLPVTGCALIILFCNEKSILNKLLSFKPLVLMGLISYSAYLLHQPILAFSRIKYGDVIFLGKIGIIFITFILSFIIWKYIETPFRDKKKLDRKKTFIIIFSSLILLLFISLTVSFSFRSNEKFSHEYRLAKKLLKNKAVLITKIDERKFIKYRIENLNYKPDIIIIGSSRTMQISEFLKNDKVLNLSMSGASIEDQVAISSILLKKYIPKKIILSADPWLFNSESGQNRWTSLTNDYLNGLKEINHDIDIKIKKNKLKFKLAENNLISEFIYKFYSKYNLENFTSSNNKPDKYKHKILQNGKRIYDEKFLQRTDAEIRKKFDIHMYYSMKPFIISDQKIEIYEKLINNLQKHTEIYLFLSPYHPNVFKRILKNETKHIMVENIFKELAKKNKIKIFGSYNPINNNCIEKDFFDGMHPKENCLKKIQN